MIEASHIQKFAAVYAEAVLTFLDSHEAQWVMWDGVSHRFDFASVELDTPEIPVMLFVDATWVQVVGDVGEIIDPDHEEFDVDALRNAIEAQITEEGYGERLLKGFQERLTRLREGLEADDEEPTPGDRDGDDNRQDVDDD